MADVELVIKMPEEQYNTIKSNLYNTFPVEMKEWGLEAIRNGIPLPKNHGRLIDADELISNICGNSCGCRLEECGYDNPCYSVTRIGSASTIIAGKEVSDANSN